MARGYRSSSSSSSYGGGSSGHPIITFFAAFITLLLIVGVIAAVLFVPQLYVIRDPLCKGTHLKFLCQDAFNVQPLQVDQDTMYVGLSDGGFPFDVHTPDGAAKQQATNDYNAGNIQAAIQDWQGAIATTTDDAEAMIYIENAQIAIAHQRYVSIIVPTTLSEVINDNTTSVSVARDDLRGVYLAQRDFNRHNNLKLRIILANLGVKDQSHLLQAMPSVLDKIRLLISSDPSVIGIVGFPFSASAKIAIAGLADEKIPIISPSASSTLLSSPYFFRVAPPDNEQGQDAAQFASQILGSRNAIVLSDNTNSYSKSLGASFASSFSRVDTRNSVSSKSFTLENYSSLDAPLHTAFEQNSYTDLIFVAGYGDDINNVKNWLKEHDKAGIAIMGGDASYELGGYDTANYSNFFFTAFAYPDTWKVLCPPGSSCASLEPTALSSDSDSPDSYGKTFDPNNQHTGEYSYSRPGPHVFLSYDATNALLQAALIALPEASGNNIPFTAMRDALQQVSFQGASGKISFSAGNPVNKSVVMLCVDTTHHTHLLGVYGNFVPGAKTLQPSANSICN